MYSRFARKREDVGRATVIGFLSVLAVLMLVTLTSYGVLPQSELAGVSQPSVASVLESIVGPWGSVFIKASVILSVLGAHLPGPDGRRDAVHPELDMPRFPNAGERARGAFLALVMAGGLVQLLLMLLFASNALDFMLDLTAALRSSCTCWPPRTRQANPDSRDVRGRRSLVPDMAVAAPSPPSTRCSWWWPAGITCCCPAFCAVGQSSLHRPAGGQLRIFTPRKPWCSLPSCWVPSPASTV